MTADDIIALLFKPFTVAGEMIEVTGYRRDSDGATWVLFNKDGERHRIELSQFERYYAPEPQCHVAPLILRAVNPCHCIQIRLRGSLLP